MSLLCSPIPHFLGSAGAEAFLAQLLLSVTMVTIGLRRLDLDCAAPAQWSLVFSEGPDLRDNDTEIYCASFRYR